MSRKERALHGYLPDPETVRKTSDQKAGDEALRRTFENPNLEQAIADRKTDTGSLTPPPVAPVVAKVAPVAAKVAPVVAREARAPAVAPPVDAKVGLDEVAGVPMGFVLRLRRTRRAVRWSIVGACAALAPVIVIVLLFGVPFEDEGAVVLPAAATATTAPTVIDAGPVEAPDAGVAAPSPTEDVAPPATDAGAGVEDSEPVPTGAGLPATTATSRAGKPRATAPVGPAAGVDAGTQAETVAPPATKPEAGDIW